MAKKKNMLVDTTFFSDDPKIRHKLSLLSFSYLQAVAEHNEKLADDLYKQARQLKRKNK